MVRNTMTVLILVLSAALARAKEQTVWQIGKPDKSSKEFALGGDYRGYEGRFSQKPLVFEIGKSEAAKDWPYVQPGPVVGWGGSGHVHPFTIRFNLADEPRGVFRLRVEFTAVELGEPTTYSVKVGGQTYRFGLQPVNGPPKIEIHLPASALHKGQNDIVVACVEGRWVEYDALTLLNDPEGREIPSKILELEAVPTPCFIRADGKLRRILQVNAALAAPAQDLTLRVEAGGETIELPVSLLGSGHASEDFFGSVSREIAVPDSPAPMDVKVIAKVGADSKTIALKLEPERKWRIFVAASAHTDIGYTDLQPAVAELHCQNLDTAADLCAKFPDFKWNTEVAWQAENYLASRKGAKLKTFLRLAREGRIGVQALYANMLTGLSSAEEACRYTYFAHSLKTRYGIPFKSAMITDVPTQEWSIPMILADSGIRYFSSGINSFRGPGGEILANSPCWWEGPDGSRVLMVRSNGYGAAEQWGLDSTLDRARVTVPQALANYENRKDYPYDAVFLHGAVVDNRGLNPALASVCQQWNRRYEFPKVILCHNAEFFEYLESHFGKRLPVVRGSGGTFWEDGAGCAATETGLNRNAHERLADAEKLLALARRLRPEIAYSATDFQNAWRNCLLFDEHTWGAGDSEDHPEREGVIAQWKIKARYAIDADRQSRALLAHGTAALASLVKTDGRGLLVINSSNWPRTDVLRVKLPEGVTVADPGAECCETAEGTLVEVKDVPPCGYRVLKLAAKADRPAAATAAPAEGNTIESPYYRVTFDPATGGVTSLYDKELRRELVDPKAPHELNQYIYAAHDLKRMAAEKPHELIYTFDSPKKATLRRVQLGDLGQRMIVETSAAMTPKLVAEVTLWNHVRRVDIVNRLTKKLTYAKEGICFAFPFAIAKPVFRYECPAGIVNPDKDMIPGACDEWFTVQHFVEVAGDDACVAWATPDAPLVDFEDITPGQSWGPWKKDRPFSNGKGYLYAYVMNNYWGTNYKAGQGGDFTFRFSITSRAKADNTASAQFGWAASNPLLAVPVEANAAGPLTAGSASLLEIAEPNVILLSAKQPEEGQGLILRLWEVSGKATTAHLRLRHLPASKATACNLVEERGPELELKDGTVAVPIRGSGLATVLLE